MAEICTYRYRGSSRWAVIRRWLRATLGLRRRTNGAESIQAAVDIIDYVPGYCGRSEVEHGIGLTPRHKFKSAKKATYRPVTA